MIFIILVLTALLQLFFCKSYRFPWFNRLASRYLGWIGGKWIKPNACYGFNGFFQAMALPIVVSIILEILFVKLLGDFGYIILGFLVAMSVIHLFLLMPKDKVDHCLYQEALHDIFALIFWFALLGPVALIFVALVQVVVKQQAFSGNSFVEAAFKKMEGYLVWVPVRLMGLSFALVGHFATALKVLLAGLTQSWTHNNEFAKKLGNAAVELDKEAGANERLIKYAVWVWIAVLALLSLGRIY